MIREDRSIAADGDTLEVDPFAFWPDIRSRLLPFGGDQEGENPDYAFHTRYVSCGTGPIVFSVRFEGLVAPRGTLILRIHELPEMLGANARQVALSQAQLVDIVRRGGNVTLPAMAREQNHYALLGFIYGDMVASAERVSIEVARRAPDPHDPSRPTRFRAATDCVDSAPRIVGDQEGILVTPVSQLCTARQLREPVFGAVLDQLVGGRDAPPMQQWEWVFIARALDRYGVAQSGARGLGIGGLGDPLGPWLLQRGCDIALTTPLPPAGRVEPPVGVAVRELDATAIDVLSGFDFAWATRAGGIDGADRQATLRFIEDALRTLKSGGLLALVLPIDVAPRAIGDDTGDWLRRVDVERIALLLLSRGHQVAQIRPWGDPIAEPEGAGAAMISAFGMIVRKA